MGDMDSFGKRLKEERERLGMSQEKFGKSCGVGKTTQYLYERGERHPDSSYLDAAAKLGVDTSYIITATRLEYSVDVAILSRLIDTITREAEQAGVFLTTEKRLRVALILYRDTKLSGEIDPWSVKNAIKIAS